MSFVYLDSSAVVKLIRREKETEALRRFLAGVKGKASVALASSTTARIEVIRAVVRSDAALAPRAAELLEMIRLIGPSDKVIAHASHLSPPTLRTLDAIHLATAVSEAEGMMAFITYDIQLAVAARLSGLPVVSPGV